MLFDSKPLSLLCTINIAKQLLTVWEIFMTCSNIIQLEGTRQHALAVLVWWQLMEQPLASVTVLDIVISKGQSNCLAELRSRHSQIVVGIMPSFHALLGSVIPLRLRIPIAFPDGLRWYERQSWSVQRHHWHWRRAIHRGHGQHIYCRVDASCFVLFFSPWLLGQKRHACLFLVGNAVISPTSTQIFIAQISSFWHRWWQGEECQVTKVWGNSPRNISRLFDRARILVMISPAFRACFPILL